MLKKDNLLLGIGIGTFLTVFTAAIILLIMKINPAIITNKAIIFAFIPPTLAMRYYAKKQLHNTMKGIVISIFVLFIAFLLFIR
ncbi:MAG: hypothetical protein LBR28_00630 [Bacteroidales bacterium]|jgi:hypothetical protein|nr:hypothetical protein [Bacteroidales bacterium]